MIEISNANSSLHWSLPRGRILLRVLQRDPIQEYMLYIPESATPESPLLVSIHGISSDSSRHAALLSPICERYSAVMLVPSFTKELHPDYQRLGRRSVRADHLLNEFVSEATTLAGITATQVHLFGFSGGAQFAHRYTMAHPHRVAHAAVAAAGWYTFPDNTQRFPYGIRAQRKLKGVAFDPESFLRVPIDVIIGSADTDLRNLRSTERTVSQQGVTRVDRARNWVTAMRRAAATYGLEQRVSLHEVPEMGHSFTAFCEQGNLVELVGKSLFGSPSAARIRTVDIVAENHVKRVEH